MYVDQGNASTVLSTQVNTHDIMPTNVSATRISTTGLCTCVCDGKDVLMEVLRSYDNVASSCLHCSPAPSPVSPAHPPNTVDIVLLLIGKGNVDNYRGDRKQHLLY